MLDRPRVVVSSGGMSLTDRVRKAAGVFAYTGRAISLVWATNKVLFVALLAFVGVYQLHSDPIAIYTMLAVGVFGYVLRKFGFSLAPVILGYVLGGLAEVNLRRALAISGGSPDVLWASGSTGAASIAKVNSCRSITPS